MKTRYNQGTVKNMKKYLNTFQKIVTHVTELHSTSQQFMTNGSARQYNLALTTKKLFRKVIEIEFKDRQEMAKHQVRT